MNARTFIVLGSAVLSAACQKAQAPAPLPPAVQVTEVVQKDVPIYREWTGSLDGFVNAEIHPQVQGYVLKKVYREGSYVREGDLLFGIDSRQTKAALSQAKGVLASGDAALAKARLDVGGRPRLPPPRHVPAWTRPRSTAGGPRSSRRLRASRGSPRRRWGTSSTRRR